jgi:hypothetical protein
MLVVLNAFFESHRADKNWTTIPALVRAVTELDSVATRAAELQEESAASGGGSASKSACFKALVPAAYIIVAALHAYAVENDDAELAAQTDVSESDIGKLNESQLVAFCSKVLSLATDLLDELADFKVAQADLTALDKKIQAYAKDCPKPRQKVAKKSADNKAYPTLFRRSRKIIDKRINKLMAPFKTSAPDFYNEYKTARKIVDQPATQGNNKPASNVVPSPSTNPESKAA